jgi:hypothetical protein
MGLEGIIENSTGNEYRAPSPGADINDIVSPAKMKERSLFLPADRLQDYPAASRTI